MIDGAWEAGGLAVLWTGERERKLLYRHTNTTDGKLERIPQAVVAREDGLRLERAALANSGKLRVRLKMPNQICGARGTQTTRREVPLTTNPHINSASFTHSASPHPISS